MSRKHTEKWGKRTKIRKKKEGKKKLTHNKNRSMHLVDLNGEVEISVLLDCGVREWGELGGLGQREHSTMITL